MKSDETKEDVDDLTEMLIRLRPARAEIDSRVVFFEAGYAACQNGRARPSVMLPGLLAASLLAALAAIPAAYQFGQDRARRGTQDMARVIPQQAVPQNVDDQSSPDTRSDVARSDIAGSDVARSDIARSDVLAIEPQPSHNPPNVGNDGDHQDFDSWNDPIGSLLAASRVQRQSDATLSVVHRSLLTSDSDRDWMTLPLATSLTSYRHSTTAVDDSPETPLAISDLQNLAQTWEKSK